MIQLYTNHPSHSESFNVVQIFESCTARIIQRRTDFSKLFNVKQIIEQ